MTGATEDRLLYYPRATHGRAAHCRAAVLSCSRPAPIIHDTSTSPATPPAMFSLQLALCKSN